MATPGWQPRPVQATAAPMAGFWGAPGTVNQSQGPPMRPPFGPPPNYPSPQSGAIPPYGTANQPSLTTGNVPLRPASAPVGTQGGPYAIPPASQPALNYGSSPNTFSGNRWPVQAAPAPTAAGVRPHASGGPPASPGMLPASSGAPQAGVVAVAPIQGPPYQGFPIGAGLGSPQQVVPPWIQPGQNFQRPPYVQYTGNFQGAFPGQQIRHMGPSSEGMPAGPPPGAVGPPFGVSSDPSLFQAGQLPLAWGQGHPGGLAGRPTAATSQGDLGSLNGNYDPDKAGPAAPGGKESAGSASALKSDKGSSQLVAESADAWTAHKTEVGTVYYYNSVSGQSTYTQPEGFAGEADKVTTQPTPVSWERLSGIDWALVTTNDGKKYYYNTRTQATSWQVPPEVAEIRKKEDDSPAKPAADAVTTVGIAAEKSPVSFTLNVPAAITGGREAIGHKVLAANSALDLIKKKLQDAGAPATSTSSSGNTSGVAIAGNGAVVVDVSNGKGAAVEGGKEKPHKGDHASSDESSESDEEDPGPSKEQKIMEFKEMLKEKGVAPFSKWEKELPKVIFDPRFKAIPSHTERRAIFEHYVRTRADVERREKRAAQKAAVEGFKQLLDEATKEISHTTTHDNFAKTWGHDPRFEALERKDRESLLNESNSIKVNPDPLCDVAEAICGIRVGPLRKAEEEKVRAEHAAAVAGFRALLLEKGEISSSSRWSKTKESLRSDSRYKVVKRDEREELFNAIIAELRAAELEVEKAAKAKKEEEEKLKERDREARKRKEREEVELERVRVKARRKDAVTAYQALLTERIKDPEASWTEARSKLEKDPSGRASNSDLDLAEKERVFREHVDELYNRCVREFRALLADVITAESAAKQGEEGKTIVTSWSEAKKVLKPDPRYSKMPRREREALWRRYAEDVQRRLKAAAAANKEENHLSSSAKAATPTRVATDVRMRSPGSRRSRR